MDRIVVSLLAIVSAAVLLSTVSSCTKRANTCGSDGDCFQDEYCNENSVCAPKDERTPGADTGARDTVADDASPQSDTSRPTDSKTPDSRHLSMDTATMPDSSISMDSVEIDAESDTSNDASAIEDGLPGTNCKSDMDCDHSFCVGTTCVHRIFVTSKRYNADLGGLEHADQKCNQRAAAAGLGGDWKAILSTKTKDARAHISLNAPVFNLDKEEIAKPGSKLWSGTVHKSITYGENLNGLGRTPWTGTKSGGTHATGNSCRDWRSTMGSDQAVVGNSMTTASGWLDNTFVQCDEKHALYCIDGQ